VSNQNFHLYFFVLQKLIASHYKGYGSLIHFSKDYDSGLTYKDKLQQSLQNKLPMDLINFQEDDDQVDVQVQALQHFWTFVCNLVAPQPGDIVDGVVVPPNPVQVTVPGTGSESSSGTASGSATSASAVSATI